MQKIKRGTGFRGVLNYVLEREEDALEEGRLIGGNMSGTTPRGLAAEFGAVRRLRPDIEKPVWHNSLRLPAGERLTDEKWVAIADDYMRRMRFTDAHPRVYVMHDDTGGQHIHIIASRIAIDGSMYLGKNENLQSTRHIASLEREYGLTVTKGPEYDPEQGATMAEKRKPTKNEIEQSDRTGVDAVRARLQRLIDKVVSDAPTAAEFAERVAAQGAAVRANIASTGRLNGFSFELDGVAFSGSQLGSRYRWAALQKRGVTYDPERDAAKLHALHLPAHDTRGLKPEDAGSLSEEFAKWKANYWPRKNATWEAQIESERRRRTAIRAQFDEAKARIYADKSLAIAARRAALSIARAEKVMADKALSVQRLVERNALRERFAARSKDAFREFLCERAQSGNVRALAELRRRRIEPIVERPSDPLLSTADRWGDDVIATGLAYRVETNGDVIYQIRGRDALRDEARSVRVIEAQDRDVIETGLRLALQKFGPVIDARGDEAFRRRCAEVAVDAGFKITFQDEALNAYKERLEAEGAKNTARNLDQEEGARLRP